MHPDLESVMNHTEPSSDPAETQAVFDLYQKAAYELLQAYQHNKEATRHHARGTSRAAVHHAHMACAHSSAAHAHLAQALQQAQGMLESSEFSNRSTAFISVRTNH